MKKWVCLLLAALAVLFCSACSGVEEGKDLKIEKRLASDGTLVCTLVDQEAGGELWDCLQAAYEDKDIVPLPEDAAALYIYTVYQAETLKAGQKREDLEMVPIMRYTVYENKDLLTEEILPEVTDGVPFVEELLTCTFQVSEETAAFLRTFV